MGRTIAGCILLGAMLAPAFAASATDDPPAEPAATISADAKAASEAVKRDAKAVANAAREGAQQLAGAAKEAAHEVAATSKRSAQEVAAAAKRGAKKTKAAVTPRKAAKGANAGAGNSVSKPEH